uniref:Proteasome activator Blm10 mid region domain-containing protein n=1 Tax=Parascaris univalens TaxID=6257 RepID=A0A914ZYI7_PARUN
MQNAIRTKISSKQLNFEDFLSLPLEIKFLGLLQIGLFRKLLITAPFSKQNELKRPFDELTTIEKVVVETLLDAGIFKQWHSILLKEKEDNDEFSNDEFLLIKYLFRNYNTIMLPLLRSLLEDIMKKVEKNGEGFFSTRAKKRLAAVYCAGLIRGSRNWSYSELSKMWAWLKPLMIAQIEGLTSETMDHWEAALKLCFDCTDPRRLHWLVEGIFEVASKPSPTAWHTCLRLNFIRYVSTCASWRTTLLLRKALKIASSLAHTASLETERTEIARILSFPAVFAFAAGNQNNIPRRFAIPGLDEMLRLFKEETKVLTEDALASATTVKDHPDKGHPVSRSTNVAIRIKSGALKDPKRLLGMKTLLEFLNTYYSTAFVGMSTSVIAVFPLVTHLANEETADSDEVQEVRDDDLIVGSSELLFHIWSGIYLRDDLADGLLSTVQMTVVGTNSWRAWVSILRFLQVLVFSNIFVCESCNRPLIIRQMVETALCHHRVEVRNEAAECLTSFIHCGHQPISDAYIKEALWSTSSATIAERHGAVLKLSSVIRAFPFTIPPTVVTLIPQYCVYGNSRDSVIKVTVTETLRSFLRTHHDKLIDQCEDQSAKLIVEAIHNVISPNYYV